MRRLANPAMCWCSRCVRVALVEIGLGRADLTAANPRLIYASFSAFGGGGRAGPRRGVDAVVQAESGLAEIAGRVMDNISVIDAAGSVWR